MLEIKLAISETVARSRSLVTDFSNRFTRFVWYLIACVLKAIKFTLIYHITNSHGSNLLFCKNSLAWIWIQFVICFYFSLKIFFGILLLYRNVTQNRLLEELSKQLRSALFVITLFSVPFSATLGILLKQQYEIRPLNNVTKNIAFLAVQS